eukprot:sb/3464150/
MNFGSSSLLYSVLNKGFCTELLVSSLHFENISKQPIGLRDWLSANQGPVFTDSVQITAPLLYSVLNKEAKSRGFCTELLVSSLHFENISKQPIGLRDWLSANQGPVFTDSVQITAPLLYSVLNKEAKSRGCCTELLVSSLHFENISKQPIGLRDWLSANQGPVFTDSVPRYTGHPDLPGKILSPEHPGKSGSDCTIMANNTTVELDDISVLEYLALCSSCETFDLNTIKPISLQQWLLSLTINNQSGHVTGYQPIRDQYLLTRSVPEPYKRRVYVWYIQQSAHPVPHHPISPSISKIRAEKPAFSRLCDTRMKAIIQLPRVKCNLLRRGAVYRRDAPRLSKLHLTLGKRRYTDTYRAVNATYRHRVFTRVPCISVVRPRTRNRLEHQLRQHLNRKHTCYYLEPTETSKQPIRTRYVGQVTGYVGHMTGYQPIRDEYFLIRSVQAMIEITRDQSSKKMRLCYIPDPGSDLDISDMYIQSDPDLVTSSGDSQNQ